MKRASETDHNFDITAHRDKRQHATDTIEDSDQLSHIISSDSSSNLIRRLEDFLPELQRANEVLEKSSSSIDPLFLPVDGDDEPALIQELGHYSSTSPAKPAGDSDSDSDADLSSDEDEQSSEDGESDQESEGEEDDDTDDRSINSVLTSEPTSSIGDGDEQLDSDDEEDIPGEEEVSEVSISDDESDDLARFETQANTYQLNSSLHDSATSSTLNLNAQEGGPFIEMNIGLGLFDVNNDDTVATNSFAHSFNIPIHYRDNGDEGGENPLIDNDDEHFGNGEILWRRHDD